MPKYQLKRILPSGIGHVWPLVQEGLDTLAKKAGPAEETDAQIRDLLMTNPRFALYFVLEDRKYIGFVILRIDENAQGRQLCIYKGFKIPEAEKLDNELFLSLKTISQECDCKSIAFYSPRRGWAREAKRHGFREGYTQYIMEVKQDGTRH